MWVSVYYFWKDLLLGGGTFTFRLCKEKSYHHLNNNHASCVIEEEDDEEEEEEKRESPQKYLRITKLLKK